MNKTWMIIIISGCFIFLTDQIIKTIFLEGFRWNGNFFSLILTYNKGVAFSMFAFLNEYLKYIQLFLVSVVGIYLFLHKEIFQKYSLPIGIIAGAALSNIYDRFIHGGVVDYFFWHYGFDFAVFNFADVMIDFGVILILYGTWKRPKEG